MPASAEGFAIVVATEYFTGGYACIFEEKSQCPHRKDDGHVLGFPFFVKYPCENKGCDDVVWGEPDKSGVERWNDKPDNAHTINDGNQGNETIFYVVHEKDEWNGKLSWVCLRCKFKVKVWLHTLRYVLFWVCF